MRSFQGDAKRMCRHEGRLFVLPEQDAIRFAVCDQVKNIGLHVGEFATEIDEAEAAEQRFSRCHIFTEALDQRLPSAGLPPGQ